jgi:uncharacterized protein YeaO (DUF488 family)
MAGRCSRSAGCSSSHADRTEAGLGFAIRERWLSRARRPGLAARHHQASAPARRLAQGAAPSTALRKWFGHDPVRWEEFRERYFRELDGQGPALEQLARRAAEGQVTLVFAARDSERNNAVALKDYLERRR